MHAVMSDIMPDFSGHCVYRFTQSSKRWSASGVGTSSGAGPGIVHTLTGVGNPVKHRCQQPFPTFTTWPAVEGVKPREGRIQPASASYQLTEQFSRQWKHSTTAKTLS